MNRQVEFLVKLRDASLMLADATNQYIQTFAPPDIEDEKLPCSINELTFSTLKFETQQGAKLGEFEIAYKAKQPRRQMAQAPTTF